MIGLRRGVDPPPKPTPNRLDRHVTGTDDEHDDAEGQPDTDDRDTTPSHDMSVTEGDDNA